MAVTRSSSKKAPSQLPVNFFECKQEGGTHGKAQRVPDVMKSGKMREAVHGRKNLGKQ